MINGPADNHAGKTTFQEQIMQVNSADDRFAAFRWYDDGHLTFGFQDTSYDYADTYASDAKYWIDDGQGYDIKGKAYSRQEIAYDLGSDRSIIDALRRGNHIRIGDVRTSLKGSSAMLADLQACVAAFR